MKDFLKILPHALTALVLALVLAATSFAWYSQNRLSYVNGANISVVDDTLQISYEMFMFNEDDQVGENVTEKLNNLNLPAYDSVILERNIHTNLIIKITIFSNNEFTTDNLHCMVFCNNDSLLDNTLSNIVEFKIAQFTIESDDPNVIYSEASANFNSIDTVSKFNNDGTKATVIDFDISEYEMIDDEVTFYLELNYAEELVGKIESFDLESFDSILHYPSDVTKIEILKEE